MRFQFDAEARPATAYARLILVALVVLLFAQVAANAEPLSARDFLAGCSGDARGRAACDGYLMALTDVVLQRESRGHTGGKICLPETVTLDQMRDAVLNVAQRPRAARAPTAIMLVMMAMRVSWPCNDQQGPQQGPRNGAPPPQ